MDCLVRVFVSQSMVKVILDLVYQKAGFGGAKRRRNPYFASAREARGRKIRMVQDLSYQWKRFCKQGGQT